LTHASFFLPSFLPLQVIDDRDNYIQDVVDADFYKMFELHTTMPGASRLKISVWDRDFMLGNAILTPFSTPFQRQFDPILTVF